MGQSFLATLCAMRWGAFLFYAAFVAAAVVFAAFCMAETKVVPQSHNLPHVYMRTAAFVCLGFLCYCRTPKVQ